jgi:hypothetical protein
MHRVKVAELDELPLGSGKTLHVEGREVTIYNDEGRFIATAVVPRHLSGTVETTCDMPGQHFAVGIDDSADRLRTGSRKYRVEVTPDGIFVVVSR